MIGNEGFPSEDRRWPVGQAEVQGMIERGEIEEVEPSVEHADLLLSQPQGHLASSELLVTMDRRQRWC